jgi:hypothetical protein
MTPLRQRTIDDMTQHGFKRNTSTAHAAYFAESLQGTAYYINFASTIERQPGG